MQQKTFRLEIPTKPYIKQWLIAKHQFGISINSSHPAILVAKLLLTGKRSIAQIKPYKTFNQNYYTDNFILCIPYSAVMNYKIGIILTPQNIEIINYIFEAFFIESLHMHIHDIYNDIDNQKAIERFCFKYNIEIDKHITLEALKKKEYRYRKNQKKYNTIIGTVL